MRGTPDSSYTGTSCFEGILQGRSWACLRCAECFKPAEAPLKDSCCACARVLMAACRRRALFSTDTK